MIKVFGIKNCDSVKKAIKFFKTHDLDYVLNDFKENAVTEKDVARWLNGSDINTLFNARSTTYRNLKLKERNLSDEDKIAYLSKENLLIKRPVIEFNNQVIVGFDQNKYEGIFLWVKY